MKSAPASRVHLYLHSGKKGSDAKDGSRRHSAYATKILKVLTLEHMEPLTVLYVQ